MNSFDVKPTNASQLHICSTCAQMRLKRDERADALELLTNGIRGLLTILTPPEVSLSDLSVRKIADFDAQRPGHPRRRSSSIKFSNGTVSPRSHWAIDSRSIRSVSGSASNVSSPSGRRTVTAAPSGSSASCSSTRPSTTCPEATRMVRRFYLGLKKQGMFAKGCRGTSDDPRRLHVWESKAEDGGTGAVPMRSRSRNSPLTGDEQQSVVPPDRTRGSEAGWTVGNWLQR